eukprot:6014650-Pyramimonas_sp.AAC.1
MTTTASPSTPRGPPAAPLPAAASQPGAQSWGATAVTSAASEGVGRRAIAPTTRGVVNASRRRTRWRREVMRRR